MLSLSEFHALCAVSHHIGAGEYDVFKLSKTL